MKHPSNEDGRREGRTDDRQTRPSDGRGSLADGLRSHFLSRTEFEAALPLFVGGELDADECARVEFWLEEHPRDRDLLEAASASRSLLQGHAASMAASPGPDLWPGIRAELASARLFAMSSSQTSSTQMSSISASGADSPVHTSHAGREPLSGGVHSKRARSLDASQPSVRWYQRRSLAAAAAFLIFGSLGGMLFDSGGPSLIAPQVGPQVGLQVDSGAEGGLLPAPGPKDAGALVAEAAPTVFTGTEVVPAPSRLAGAKRGTRLRRVVGPSNHILDHAVPLRLEQAQFPEIETEQSRGLPGDGSVQLTGGR